MSNSKIILAAAAFLLWLAARLPAETVTTTSMIESVDTTSRMVTVRRKTAKGVKTAKLAVGSNAAITVDGQSGDLASLKAGQSATISYDTTAKQVTGISVGSASAPSARGRGTNGVRVPDDAATFEGHSYKFFREVMTWRQAKQRCERLGGHLATIGGEAENDFVTVLARSGIANPGRLDGVWLGATDERREGEWRWTDGGRALFTNWLPGEPDNKQNAEHYLLLLLKDGNWCDQPERSKQCVTYFVCEWDASGSGDASDERSSISGASSRAALPLIHGDTLDGWRPVPFTSSPNWSVQNDILTDLGGPSLATKETFGDFDLHLEFSLPHEGNSGVYLRGRYEVQLLDSGVKLPGGQPVPPKNGCGSIVGQIAPSRDVYKGPNQWNTLDVRLDGRTVTVRMNNVTVIDAQVIEKVTEQALDDDEAMPGPIMIQSRGSGGARFRNITITPR